MYAPATGVPLACFTVNRSVVAAGWSRSWTVVAPAVTLTPVAITAGDANNRTV